MNKAESIDGLPHRPPFLFVDQVLALDADRICTRVLADPQAEFFRGHYPGNPVMPGVLLCECCFQAGALLVGRRLGTETAAKTTPVITRIREAKFRHIVRPGDILEVAVQLDEQIDDVFFMTGRLTVGEQPALRVTFAATAL